LAKGGGESKFRRGETFHRGKGARGMQSGRSKGKKRWPKYKGRGKKRRNVMPVYMGGGGKATINIFRKEMFWQPQLGEFRKRLGGSWGAVIKKVIGLNELFPSCGGVARKAKHKRAGNSVVKT